MPIPIEDIDDQSIIYLRVNAARCRKMRDRTYITASAMKPIGNGLSTDWNKYSTPEQSRDRAKKPPDNGIIGAVVREVKDEGRFCVVHDPLDENPSHTLVHGIPLESEDRVSNARARLKLLGLFHIVLSASGHPEMDFWAEEE